MDMWNYRIMKHTTQYITYYGLHEVYYRDGEPWMWTEEPDIVGETVEEIGEALSMMLDDYKKSCHNVLDYHSEVKDDWKN